MKHGKLPAQPIEPRILKQHSIQRRKPPTTHKHEKTEQAHYFFIKEPKKTKEPDSSATEKYTIACI
ncbi:MAG: hypothetical protein ACRCZ5_10890 [Burkholderiales bacterium]